MTHPLDELLAWFPALDFAVLEHGFAPHGRDYALVVETDFGARPGRHRLTFTHAVEVLVRTRVRDGVWPRSWDDVFTDYAAWQQAGEPDGYVWGSNWSLAYPGFSVPSPAPRAAEWSTRLERPMYEVILETDRMRLDCCFHALRTEFLDDRADLVSQVVIPLP